MRMRSLLLLCLTVGCVGTISGSVPDPDAAPMIDAPPQPPKPQCEWGGAPGSCLSQTDCAAMTDRTDEPGTICASPLGCCIDTPNVADNPPTPAGWKLMKQADVTTAMTDWAVAILHDPVTYPMWSTTTMQFPTLLVLARVEWHPPDFLNGVIHRGVTLYEPS
jgi:hypothetical protein